MAATTDRPTDRPTHTPRRALVAFTLTRSPPRSPPLVASLLRRAFPLGSLRRSSSMARASSNGSPAKCLPTTAARAAAVAAIVSSSPLRRRSPHSRARACVGASPRSRMRAREFRMNMPRNMKVPSFFDRNAYNRIQEACHLFFFFCKFLYRPFSLFNFN